MRLTFGLAALFFSAAASAAAAPAATTTSAEASDLSPGSPRYNCHADCGNVLLLSSEEEFCSRDDFKKDLKSCLNCANKFDIWQYYGTKVKKAADACDMDDKPKEYSEAEKDKPSTTSSDSKTTTRVTVTATAESKASGKGGLAKGAIAGIVVSCVVGVVIIIVAAIFFFKHRRLNAMAASHERSQQQQHELSVRGVKWGGQESVAERQA
ncbi:hypothetical protein KEM55_005721 [Ascosphaera atra]|nr:hypothetical protein KEM55_005721 [Ascosphaera atra]